MPHVTRHSALRTLTRPRLHELGQRLERSAPRSATKELLVETLAALPLPALLAELRFDELKQACRTHDLDNLYICDASVLPTSAAVNPSLTIAALAEMYAGLRSLRLADGEDASRDAREDPLGHGHCAGQED